jgi:hypothetical protein
MIIRRLTFAGVVLASITTAAVAGAATAPAGAPGGTAAVKRISGEGVGQVKLGKRHSALREQGLVGPLRPGCEFGGPNTRSAKLKAPLKGSVNYTLTAPRTVTDITIRGGAKARGVGIGATIAQIKAKFPKAKVSHATDEVFGVTLVRIPKDGGGKFQFAVSVDTGRTELIGIPRIAFCE